MDTGDRSKVKKWMDDASRMLRSLEVGRRLLEEEVGDVVKQGMDSSDAAIKLKCSMIWNLMNGDVDSATTNMLDLGIYEYQVLSKNSILKKMYKLTDDDIVSKITEDQISITFNTILSEIMIKIKNRAKDENDEAIDNDDMPAIEDTTDLLNFTKLLDLDIAVAKIVPTYHAQIRVCWNLTESAVYHYAGTQFVISLLRFSSILSEVRHRLPFKQYGFVDDTGRVVIGSQTKILRSSAAIFVKGSPSMVKKTIYIAEFVYACEDRGFDRDQVILSSISPQYIVACRFKSNDFVIYYLTLPIFVNTPVYHRLSQLLYTVYTSMPSDCSYHAKSFIKFLADKVGLIRTNCSSVSPGLKYYNMNLEINCNEVSDHDIENRLVLFANDSDEFNKPSSFVFTDTQLKLPDIMERMPDLIVLTHTSEQLTTMTSRCIYNWIELPDSLSYGLAYIKIVRPSESHPNDCHILTSSSDINMMDDIDGKEASIQICYQKLLPAANCD